MNIQSLSLVIRALLVAQIAVFLLHHTVGSACYSPRLHLALIKNTMSPT